MDIFGYSPIVSPIYVEPAFDRSNVVTTSQRQPRTVTGLIDSGAGFSIVQYSDGTTERREDARGIRNNNPGNLTGTLQGALRQGAVAVDHGGNYVFPDAQTGQRAMANFVLQRNADRSVGDMLSTYAPAGAANDPNNTNRLYPSMVQGAGFNLGDRVGALPAAEQQRLLDTMMGIETGQPAPARQVATLNSLGRGPAKRAMAGTQNNATTNPMFQQLGTPGDSLQVDPNTAQPRAANPMFQQLGTPGDALQVDPNTAQAGTANQMFQQLGTPGDQLDTGAPLGGGRADRTAAANKARTLGLMGDVSTAETLAATTAGAVQEASSRGGFAGAKPLPRKERQKFSPESLGLIAFGLSLMSGADMAQAAQIGMQTYNTVEDKRSAKAQREAVDAFIAKQSPETQELMRIMGDDVRGIADVAILTQEQQVENEEKAALAVKRRSMEQQLMAVNPELTQSQLAALEYDDLTEQYTDQLFKDRGIRKTDYTDREWTAAETAFQMKLGADTIVEMLGPDKGINNFDVGDRKRFNAAKDAIKIAYITYKSGAAFSEAEEKLYDGILNWQNFSFDNVEANEDAMNRLQNLMQMLARRSNGAYSELLNGPSVDLDVNFGALKPQPLVFDAGGVPVTVEAN